MATSRGGDAVRRFIARIPADLERKVLRGAARAAIGVVKDEAAARVTSDEVREALVTRSKAEPGRIVVKLTVKGQWPHSIATWLEHGTAPHFIGVDESQREGRSIGRINRLVRDAGGDASLVIGGRFVGETVHHPGATPHPFLRPALDIKEREAVAAAQAYISARVGPAGITGDDEPESDEA